MNFNSLSKSIWSSAVAALLATVLLMITYFAFEPAVSQAVDSNNFVVTQEVTGAIAFATEPGDVSMSGTLNGLTGGTATGQTDVRVTTNNSGGYNMTIKFASTTAMLRNGAGPEIYNFQYSTGTAGYPTTFNTDPAYAQFGFTVNASNTAEVSPVFTDDGAGTCGTANNGNFAVNNCWRGASSTDETAGTQLILTSAPTPASGSTSTVMFRVTIPNGPNPSVPDGFYYATATLTALDN